MHRYVCSTEEIFILDVLEFFERRNFLRNMLWILTLVGSYSSERNTKHYYLFTQHFEPNHDYYYYSTTNCLALLIMSLRTKKQTFIVITSAVIISIVAVT